VLITSWNEWYEGSELEPSVQYGEKILKETTAYAQKFLAADRRRK
jgi:glycoprotein endo-alpha-1,2-mannosidase